MLQREARKHAAGRAVVSRSQPRKYLQVSVITGIRVVTARLYERFTVILPLGSSVI